jgi:phytoene desaturase
MQHTKSGHKQVVVVGAGIGGMSAAIRLATAGCRVTVVEALDRPGGKMGELREAGFRFDTGPSVITMRHVFERLFRDAGRDLRDYLDLVPLNPITRYHWRDGLVLDAVSDEDAMCAQIERVSPRDVDGYRRFMRYVAGLYHVVSEPFLYRRKPTLRDLLHLPLGDVLKVDGLRTLHAAVKSYFHDPHLVQLFDRFATYNGSSPYRAPATFNVIAHVEMVLGAWYPRGGVYQLARAFERLAVELGVEFRYSSPVGEVQVSCTTNTSHPLVTGVELTKGGTITADAVVCNVDYTHAQQTLLTPLLKTRGKQQRKMAQPLEPSCSGFVMMLGVHTEPNDFAHHNIFFSDDYRREFDDIFDRRIPPTDPSLYLCITSKTDPDHAPQRCENWFVMVNAPYLSETYKWDAHADEYAVFVKRELVARKVLASEQDIVLERRWTPQDLQNTFGGYAGSIYGFSSNGKRAAFMRPNNRSTQAQRLYFVGGSVYPGGGVPLVTLSGMAAAECVLEDR